MSIVGNVLLQFVLSLRGTHSHPHNINTFKYLSATPSFHLSSDITLYFTTEDELVRSATSQPAGSSGIKSQRKPLSEPRSGPHVVGG